jgi:hypothetical protein
LFWGTKTILAVLILLLFSEAALASVCVTIDPERDNLSKMDQEAAKMILLDTFEKVGHL